MEPVTGWTAGPVLPHIDPTGLCNPRYQIDQFRRGVLTAVVGRREDGTVVRKAGGMAVVVQGARSARGDSIDAVLPAPPLEPLEPV